MQFGFITLIGGLILFVYSLNYVKLYLLFASFLLIGAGNSISDSVNEGCAKSFEGYVIGHKTMGVLFSGIFGSGFYLILKFISINKNYCFILIIFLAFVNVFIKYKQIYLE